MNYRTILITLTVATLAACAADDNDQQAAITEAEIRKNDILIEERVRELTGQTRIDESTIVVVQTPLEDKSQGKTEPAGQRNNLKLLLHMSRNMIRRLSRNICPPTVTRPCGIQ